MTIRLRFYAILGAIAVLMAGLALGSVYAVKSSQTLVDHLFRNALLPSLDLKTVSDGYTNAGIVTAVRVRTGNLSWEEGEQTVRRMHERVRPAWDEYLAQVDVHGDGALEREAAARMVDADAALDELADILAGQDVAGLTSFIARVMYPSIQPLLTVIERLTEQQDRFGQSVFGASRDMIRSQQSGLAVLLVVAALAFLGAVATLRTRVVRPLVEMTRAMSAVAGGTLDVKIPSTGRRDEIGALAEALVQFRDNALLIQDNERRLRQLAHELAEARDRAEEATRAKSAFLAMMSHEIRTPMNGVMSMAEMLDQSELTADQRSMSGVIRQSAAALLAIINDILDFSKIEAGKLEIERVPFSLLEVVEGAAGLVAARAEERGLELVVDADPGLADRRAGDPSRLRQILLNLMGNAVKFTESGSVTLRVAVPARVGAGDAERLRFEVRDTGIGLSPEQCAKLFQPFMQADSSTARKYGGTGLGLSICQRLCGLMDGEIGVDSVKGQGSTFWFELPLAALEPAPLAPEVAIADAVVVLEGFSPAIAAVLQAQLQAAGIVADTAAAALGVRLVGPAALAAAAQHERGAGEERRILLAPRGLIAALDEQQRAGFFTTLSLPPGRKALWRAIAAALGRASLESRSAGNAQLWEAPEIETARVSGALILVAEDNPTNQVVIRRLLGRNGYAHEIAANGREALALLERGGHGLLLTDFHMPEMDGFQLTAAIRAREFGQEEAARLPIVALTADAMPGTEQQCLAAGMDGFLTKPIDSQALLAVLETRLPQALGLRQPAQPAISTVERKPAPQAAAIDPAIFDPERLRESFGALGDEARAFLASFLAGVPAMLAEIDAALAAGDSAAARDAVHALKGAAASVGAVRLSQVAADAQNCLDGGDVDTAALMASLLAPTHEELVTATATLC